MPPSLKSFRLAEEAMGRIVEIVPSVMLRCPHGNKKIWAKASGLGSNTYNLESIREDDSRL